MPKPGYKLVKWYFGKYEEIPQDWENKQIDEMIKFEGGSQPPRSDFVFEPTEGYVRMIQIRDFKTEHYATYIPKKQDRRFFEKDDVMIGRYGPPNFQILRGLSGAYNVALIKAVPKNDVEKNYLYYFLKQNKFFNFMDSLGQRTAGQDGVELDLLKKLPFPLPPKKEREKIATILSSVDELISSYDKVIDSTKLLKKGLMQTLLTKGIGHKKFKKIKWYFGKELEIPEAWNVVKLGEITSITKLAGFEYTEYWKTDENGPIIALRGYNVQQNRLVLDDIQTISKELSDFLIRSKLYKDNIVFPFVGSIGNAARIPENDKFHINQNVAKISVQDELQSLFLVFVLLGEYIKKQIIMQNTSGTQPSVLLGNLRNFIILLPDREEQQKIVSILSMIDSKISELESKKTNLETLKKGLLQKLLTGQIRVQV